LVNNGQENRAVINDFSSLRGEERRGLSVKKKKKKTVLRIGKNNNVNPKNKKDPYYGETGGVSKTEEKRKNEG